MTTENVMSGSLQRALTAIISQLFAADKQYFDRKWLSQSEIAVRGMTTQELLCALEAQGSIVPVQGEPGKYQLKKGLGFVPREKEVVVEGMPEDEYQEWLLELYHLVFARNLRIVRVFDFCDHAPVTLTEADLDRDEARRAANKDKETGDGLVCEDIAEQIGEHEDETIRLQKAAAFCAEALRRGVLTTVAPNEFCLSFMESALYRPVETRQNLDDVIAAKVREIVITQLPHCLDAGASVNELLCLRLFTQRDTAFDFIRTNPDLVFRLDKEDRTVFNTAKASPCLLTVRRACDLYLFGKKESFSATQRDQFIAEGGVGYLPNAWYLFSKELENYALLVSATADWDGLYEWINVPKQWEQRFRAREEIAAKRAAAKKTAADKKSKAAQKSIVEDDDEEEEEQSKEE